MSLDIKLLKLLFNRLKGPRILFRILFTKYYVEIDWWGPNNQTPVIGIVTKYFNHTKGEYFYV